MSATPLPMVARTRMGEKVDSDAHPTLGECAEKDIRTA